MQVRDAVAKSHDRERIANHPIAVERAQHLSSGMRRNNKHGCRLDFQILLAPNLALQLHAAVEFLQTLALAYHNLGAHRFVRASLSSAAPRFPSESLVVFQ